MRVSSNYQFQQSLRQMQNSNSKLNTLSYQVTSGYKAQRFQDISDDANRMLNMKDAYSNISVYESNINTSISHLRSQEQALSEMSDLLQDAAKLWTLGRSENSPESRAAMAPQAEGLADSFFTLMNTQFDGRYIFSGQAGERQTITASPTANTFPGDPPPTTYFNGDPTKLQVLTDTSTSQTYGVTGDNVGIARMKAGLETLWYGLENNSTADIDGAITLLEQAQKDISNMLGQVGGEISSLNMTLERHSSNKQFMTEQIDALEKVDVSEALIQTSQEETTLQASMLVITKLQSLSLLDYIR